jgi:tetratricopeptide (TPR) repeat protein
LKSAQTYVRKIKSLEKLGQLEEARALSKELLSKFPMSKEAQLADKRLARSLTNASAGDRGHPINQTSFDAIVQAFNAEDYISVIERVRDYPSPISLPMPLPSIIGISHLKVGDFQESVNILNQVYEKRNGDVQDLNNLAIALKAAGEIESAIEKYQTIVKQQPKFSAAYYNLGNLYVDKKELKKAIVSFEKAIDIDPMDYSYGLGLLRALVLNEDFDKSLEVGKRLCLVHSDRPEAYLELASVYETSSNHHMALKYFEKTIEICRYKSSNNPGLEISQPFMQRAFEKKLECHLMLGQYDLLNNLIAEANTIKKRNVRFGAISAYLACALNQDGIYNFCNNPLDHISVANLSNYRKDYDSLISQLLAEASKRDLVWEPTSKTTKSGYQSDSELFRSKSEGIVTLESILRQEIKDYRLRFRDSDSAYIQDWPESFDLTGWYVQLMQSGYQESHIHPSGWLSGVVYLKTVDAMGRDEGAIEFGLRGYGYPEFISDAPTTRFNPTPGDIVLFPSSLFHKTIPFDSNTERCIIAFDVTPRW